LLLVRVIRFFKDEVVPLVLEYGEIIFVLNCFPHF
jgi:hypothetical protein